MAKARGDAGLSDETRDLRIGRGIVSWDGRVLELFGFEAESRRVHVGLIESAEITEGKILGTVASFTVRGTGPVSVAIGEDPSERAALEQILGEIRAAIA